MEIAASCSEITSDYISHMHSVKKHFLVYHEKQQDKSFKITKELFIIENIKNEKAL